MSDSVMEPSGVSSFELVLPSEWRHFPMDKNPEKLIRAQIRAALKGAQDGGRFERRLTATVLRSIRDMRQYGVSDFYLPAVQTDDGIVPIPASMMVTPIAVPQTGISAVVGSLISESSLATSDAVAGTLYIGERRDAGRPVGDEELVSQILQALVLVPGGAKALYFEFAILSPDEIGEEKFVALQMLFLSIIHSLRWLTND